MINDWTIENVESISQSVIKMAIAMKQHPYQVLDQMMKLGESFELEDTEGFRSACKQLIKSQANELPFSFYEPVACENCTVVYSDVLQECPVCGHVNHD